MSRVILATWIIELCKVLKNVCNGCYLCTEQSLRTICCFQPWQLLPSWPMRTLTGLLSLEPPSLALQDARLCPVICSRLCNDLGRCWPARMNEGLRHGGMNSSPIFTTTEAVHDRRLPTGQLLWVRMALVIHELHWAGMGGKSQHQNWSHLYIRSPTHPVACTLSVKGRLIWADMKQ